MNKQEITTVIENYLLYKVNIDFMQRRIKEGKLPLAKNQIEELAISISAIQEQSMEKKHIPFSERIGYSSPNKEQAGEGKEKLYPCTDCGKLRTKDEGGTTFTVCEECWGRYYGESHPSSPERSCGTCYHSCLAEEGDGKDCVAWKPKVPPSPFITPTNTGEPFPYKESRARATPSPEKCKCTITSKTGQWITNGICNDCGLPVKSKVISTLPPPSPEMEKTIDDLLPDEYIQELKGRHAKALLRTVELEKEINDRKDCEKSLTEWNEKLAQENQRYREALGEAIHLLECMRTMPIPLDFDKGLPGEVKLRYQKILDITLEKVDKFLNSQDRP